MKKTIVLILTFVLSLALVSSVGAEESNSSAIDTPQKYIQYLESQVNLRTIDATVETSNNNFIEQFKKLDTDKQEKFVAYLNDPEFLQTLLTAQVEENKSQSFYNGDLVVTNQVETVPTSGGFQTKAVGDTVMYQKQGIATSTVLGLDLVKTQVFLSIFVKEVKPNASEVTVLVNGGGNVIQSYVPTLTIAKTVLSPYITPDRKAAVQEVDWQWNATLVGGLTFGTVRQWISIDKAGNGDTGAYQL